jgi:hypothetical protein
LERNAAVSDPRSGPGAVGAGGANLRVPSPGAPDGQAVVLDVAQLQALLAKTFNVGSDVGRGKEPVALMCLRLGHPHDSLHMIDLIYSQDAGQRL